MSSFKWTLQNKSLVAFLVGLVLATGLIVVTWQGLTQTRAAVNEFEALLIPEIRNALSLSDEAAQIVAMAPYLASAGRPMQLQTERQRLQKRYELAYSLSEKLQNTEIREELQASLADIQADLNRLAELVYEELFTREDLLAAQFEVDQLAERQSFEASVNPWLPLQLYFLSITQPEHYAGRNRDGLTPLATATELSDQYLDWLALATKSHRGLLRIDQSKAFLLARLRTHSEQLTQQTNTFAADIQKVVLDQQRAVSIQVSRSMLMTVGLALVLLLGIGIYYLNNRRLIRDLSVVTEDMGYLSRGEDAPARIDIERDDEIGDLVTAYDIFRDHALAAERTSNELDAQKTLLETIFNQIQDGLSVFSADGRLVTWNRRYLEMFGFVAEDIHAGMSLDEVQALMSRKRHRNLNLHQQSVDMQSLNAERHHSNQSFERHYDDGQIIEFRSQPMPNGGFVTLYSDLTERRAAEQQLQQSQKMEVLGQLTGGVAHDFNNLLAALMGNLQLLDRLDNMPDKATKYLQRALNVSERGAQLVQRLLAFSRKQQLQPEWVRVDPLLDGMAELLEYSVSQHITLSLDLAAPEATLFIDPSQLENAILNLALNSAAAIPGGGRIAIRSWVNAAEGTLSVQVADTGTGIPTALQKRVLEPFFTTKPVGQGSGLGLSTVYGFVRQSGGDFRLESVPEQGTTITLTWPLARDPQPESVEATLEPIRFDASRGVALVEDDASVREALTELFEQRGFTVHSFEHGEQFIDWAQHSDSAAGLLISDVNLAGHLTGLDVVNMASKYWPETRCLLISGLPKERLEQELGLDITWPFIQKPLTQAMFRQLFP
ncbi:hybrid sensor histidine kinase/response regulator [Saccharospirillum salsuginis]|uniref:histidine kinase n=1 Tax=Saccharospirillum salsuginis TaxID=418750 RepID=A0A918K473_9GAMM|nr:PAS-domain containing protein [Saccharospirillum salsuginis]GGX48601.1 histidine kinase [Saccharospirillum salsuginis]